jgi:hypothetical protein
MGCCALIASLLILAGDDPSLPVPEEVPALSPARRLWEQGQQEMRQGHPDKAIACYRQSLALDPQFSQAHLSLAAAHLETGDGPSACPHLRSYLDARPDQVLVRGHYAELLFRLHRVGKARDEFNRYIADAQDAGGQAEQNLLHSHSRLMEIAEQEEDEYAEHLHRGVGLLLLARARAALSDEERDPERESLLCKAAGELTLAREERPEAARPCWYLYQVWSALAQRHPANRWLRAAQAAAAFSDLTPAEARSLQMVTSPLGRAR